MQHNRPGWSVTREGWCGEDELSVLYGGGVGGVHNLEDQTVAAADGVCFPVSRVGDRAGAPVVLVPGMCDNRRVYWTPAGAGLANHFASLGYDVWIVDRRGTRGYEVPTGVRRGWNEAVQLDLPAAQRHIARHSPFPAIWIGHSYGGVIISRALGKPTLDREMVAGVVLVGSAIDVPLMRSRVLRRIARARVWKDPVPTHVLGFGPEDEYRDQLEDMFAWSDRECQNQSATTELEAVTVPLLEMPGYRDFLSPPSSCDRLATAYGSTDRQRIQIARQNGFNSDFGHDTLLMNRRRPRTDVFDAITEWISSRTHGPANESR